MAVAFAMVIMLPGGAYAYRTTENLPEFMGAGPVVWHDGTVPCYLHASGARGLPLAEVERALLGALEEWTLPICANPPVHYAGVTTQPVVSGDGQNGVQWVNVNWAERGFPRDASATTDILYRMTDDGWVLAEADIYVNGEDYQWHSAVVEPGSFDRSIRSVLMHEFGHVHGILHPCEEAGTDGAPDCATDPSYATAAMFPFYTGSETLAADDEAAVCHLYPDDAAEPSDVLDDGAATCVAEAADGACGPRLCHSDFGCQDNERCDGGTCRRLGGLAGEPCSFSADCAVGVILPRFRGRCDYAAISVTRAFNSNSMGLT